VLRVTHLITDLDTGGAEIMLLRLLQADRRRNLVQNVVSLTTVGAIGQRIGQTGAEVHALGVNPSRPSPAAIVKLAGLVRRLQPDILQTWLYHADFAGTLVAPLARVPRLVWNIRCAALDRRDLRVSQRLLMKTLANLSARPDLVICNSQAGVAAHQQLGYRPRGWMVIANGLDTGEFRPRAGARSRLRAQLGLPETARVIGLLARYHPMKDHESFLQAAAIVCARRPDAHFVAAGRGIASHPVLTAAVDRLGLRGRVSLLDEQAPVDFLSALDVAVNSSYSEGFPNVVAEAMACGVPCVVTDVGDAAHIVGDAGVVTPPRDPEKLAAGVLQLLACDACEWERLRTAARSRIVERFSLAEVTARYERVYADLAGQAGRAAESHPCAE
jgi:glycosyltransferase involved in cell wall biosynthesis